MAISIDWGTKVITVPQNFLSLLTGVSYQLDTNALRIALKELEESEAGITFPTTHNHNTVVILGGIEYARAIEIINGYTITFENVGTPYKVFLVGSNNNILDVTNLNNVSVAPNNSAGLIQSTEIQQGAFESVITVDTAGTAGTLYPTGTGKKPVSNINDAKTIATARGIKNFFLNSNYTLGATDNVAGLHLTGKGATLNVSATAHTKVTLTQGCITTNSNWEECVITGYQGGESHYTDCIIDGLENAHCFYERCGMLDGTARGWTIKQAISSNGHASYYKECFSDEGTFILDRNGTAMNVTMDGFTGRVKIINQNHATSSGQVWIHLTGGTITIDASCTKGKITVTGTGVLVNLSQGTDVDASAFLSEGFTQMKLDIESLRPSHQGFGARWYCDWDNGNDLSPGNSASSPLKTITAAIAKATSGRGDVIYLMAPSSGSATFVENVVLNKEDVHIRGPGRGVNITPTSGVGIHVTAQNCSLSGFVSRTYANATDDNIIINAKFCRLQDLYIVGADSGGVTPNSTGVGLHFKGGDYHKVINCEIEKAGSDGVRFSDAPIAAEGSPREVQFRDCNIYYNRGSGIKFTGTSSNSTRLNIVMACRIQHNSEKGIWIGINTQRTMVLGDNFIRDNGTYPTGVGDPANEIYIEVGASDVMISESLDTVNTLFKPLLTTANYLALK